MEMPSLAYQAQRCLCSGFFFYCNENNYGWKHFANDEVVRASIWIIWFQLCQEVTFNLGFKPVREELKEQPGCWAVFVHETWSSSHVCVQNKAFRAPSSDIWVQSPVPKVSQAVQKGICKPDKLGILCSRSEPAMLQRIKVRSRLTEISLFPAMIPQHFSDL